jgi:hypothetical protein
MQGQNYGDEKLASHDNTSAAKILEPLRFLLAARRGVHNDPSLESVIIPNERGITFAGPSGVKAINRMSTRYQWITIYGRTSSR